MTALVSAFPNPSEVNKIEQKGCMSVYVIPFSKRSLKILNTAKFDDIPLPFKDELFSSSHILKL
jgi:hypothetical protein